METNLLTPGEKIKKIRKDFKIKQSDLTEGKITRNLISLIENNKADLKESTAKIISDSVNRICKERNIDFIITPNDLLMNNTLQADKILDDLIALVDTNANNKYYDFSAVINKAEKLIKHNPHLDKIIDFYLKLADSFMYRDDYWQAYIFNFKAYEHIDLKKLPTNITKTAINLSYCCNAISKFSESIQILNAILSLNIKITPIDRYKILLNKALAQKNLEQYENTIQTLHEIHDITLADAYLFKIKTLEANCYKELKQFKYSLNIYFDLCTEKYCENPTQHIITLCNIVDLYISIYNLKEAKKYFVKAINLLSQSYLIIPKYYFIPVYYTLVNASKEMHDYDSAIILLTEVLKTAKADKLYNFQFNSLNDLLSIYLERKDYAKIEDLKLSVMELLNKDNKAEYHILLYKYIHMYSIQNKKDDIDSLVSYAIKLNSKNI